MMAYRRNFKVLCKKAAADADEWYRLAAFQDALKEQSGEPARPRQCLDIACCPLATKEVN